MTLQQRPQATILYQGQEYPFHPFFNRVLTLLTEVFPSSFLTDEEKIRIAVNALSEAPVNKDVFELILLELFPKQKEDRE